jgi:hypothetical protein
VQVSGLASIAAATCVAICVTGAATTARDLQRVTVRVESGDRLDARVLRR